MYRLVNLDINNEVWGEVETLEEAKRIQEEEYFFMTGIEKFENRMWVPVKGIHEEVCEEINKVISR